MTALVRCAAFLLLLASASTAGAQVSERRVRDAIDDAARGLGQAIAGGSALTGPSVATGGLGHFAIGAAGSVTFVEIEDPRRSEGTIDFALPTGTVHGALGLWDGTDLAPGVGGFGALDLIGRFGPVVAREEIEESEVVLSLGARIGILREGAALPEVSVTAYRSRVDDLAWGDPAGDEVSFVGDVRSWSLRADVSKRLLVVTPYAGVGIDRTSIDAAYVIPAGRSTGGQEIRGSAETSSVHHKAYAGLELGLLLLDTSVEIGSYDGGVFGAIGVRIAH